MTPVINPFWFYLIDVADSFMVIFIGMSVASFVFFAYSLLHSDEDICSCDEEHLKWLKRTKLSFVCVIASLFLVAAMPSGKTITKIIIAKNVTYERFDKTTDVVESVYNDIIRVLENNGEVK